MGFALAGFFGFPLGGIIPELSCEMLFPIAEGTATGTMNGSSYIGSAYIAIYALILEKRTETNSIIVVLILSASWMISVWFIYRINEVLKRRNFK